MSRCQEIVGESLGGTTELSRRNDSKVLETIFVIYERIVWGSENRHFLRWMFPRKSESKFLFLNPNSNLFRRNFLQFAKVIWPRKTYTKMGSIEIKITLMVNYNINFNIKCKINIKSDTFIVNYNLLICHVFNYTIISCHILSLPLIFILDNLIHFSNWIIVVEEN